MADTKTLTEKDILNKKFTKNIKGYDSAEVDGFLDQVIKDYVYFQKDIGQLNAQISSLQERCTQLENAQNKGDAKAFKNRIHELEIENASLKNRLGGLKDDDNVNKDNIDYIKRIRELEKFVWSLGYNPVTFKKRDS